MKTFKFKGQTYEVPQGKSLYDVVVENGYEGTRVEFIKDLFKLDTLKERIKK
jgi:hypothetical protein